MAPSCSGQCLFLVWLLVKVLSHVKEFSEQLYNLMDCILKHLLSHARTSSNPLISQMMVYNVITAMNGSTIYCSEDSNANGAPMATITVTNEGI